MPCRPSQSSTVRGGERLTSSELVCLGRSRYGHGTWPCAAADMLSLHSGRRLDCKPPHAALHASVHVCPWPCKTHVFGVHCCVINVLLLYCHGTAGSTPKSKRSRVVTSRTAVCSRE